MLDKLSLGLRTELMMLKPFGGLTSHFDCLRFVSPAMPDYFFGNCLIFQSPQRRVIFRVGHHGLKPCLQIWQAFGTGHFYGQATVLTQRIFCLLPKLALNLTQQP